MMLRRTVLVAALLVAVMPGSARADKVIEAQVVWKFDAPKYTIDQGEKVVFRNSDSVSPGNHDVTSDVVGPDGKTPIFRSATIDDGQEAPVEGVQQLKPGTYSFHCSIHTFMQATLEVTQKGTPPSTETAPPPQAAQPADTQKPKVSAKLKPTTLRRARKARAVVATVTSDELVNLHLVLTARVRGRTVTLGQLTATDGAPRRKVDFTVRLSAAGRRALRRARRLSVALAVRATDQADNVTTTRTTRRLRR